MKSLLIVLAVTYTGLMTALSTGSNESAEILVKAPLLSAKNIAVMSSGLKEVNGIRYIEACYDLRVMIIGFDKSVITSEGEIIGKLERLNTNTTFELIHSSDIPKIRQQYKVTIVSG